MNGFPTGKDRGDTNAATADQGDGSVSGEGPMTAPSPSSAASRTERPSSSNAASVSRADTIRRALRVNISQAEHEEVLAALDSLLTDRDRYREALELLAGDEYAGSLAHTIAVAALYEEPSRV